LRRITTSNSNSNSSLLIKKSEATTEFLLNGRIVKKNLQSPLHYADSKNKRLRLMKDISRTLKKENERIKLG